jgi:hypothetical protein
MRVLRTSDQNELKQEVNNMWNMPSKERLAGIPKLYETEDTPLTDKLIHLHFFIGGCDWYIAEYDGEDLFWGFACLNQDLQNAEWGYISYPELKEIKIAGWLEIDCETEVAWRIRPASEVKLIREASGWPIRNQAPNRTAGHDYAVRPT